MRKSEKLIRNPPFRNYLLFLANVGRMYLQREFLEEWANELRSVLYPRLGRSLKTKERIICTCADVL